MKGVINYLKNIKTNLEEHQIKNKHTKVITTVTVALLTLSTIILYNPINQRVLTAYDANMGSSGDGTYGPGGSNNYLTGDEGARITIVHATTGDRAFRTINISRNNQSTNIRHYGLKNKLEYQRDKTLYLQRDFESHRVSNFPKLIGSGKSSLETVKTHIKDAAFHKQIIDIIPELAQMGEENALAELASGKYKILIEPWTTIKIDGATYCMTATEVGLVDIQQKGELDTHQPKSNGGFRGNLARYAPDRLYNHLARSAYLEWDELGLKVFTNSPSELGQYRVNGSPAGYLPLNRTMIERMGVAILSISDNPPIPPINLKVNKLEGSYNRFENTVKISAAGMVDPTQVWKVADEEVEEGKIPTKWRVEPSLPAPTEHRLYLQWGSDWDNKTGKGISKEHYISNTEVFVAGSVHHLKDPKTESPELIFELPEIPPGETFIVARYAINANDDAPKFSKELDLYERKESTKADNAEYLIIDLENQSNTNFLLAGDIDTNYDPPVDPCTAYWDEATSRLVVRAIGMMDKNGEEQELVESNIQLDIVNTSFPAQNINEYSGIFNTKEFREKEYQIMNSHEVDLVGGTGMAPIVNPGSGVTKFEIKKLKSEQLLKIRMEINPTNSPAESYREDNVWEHIVRIPAGDDTNLRMVDTKVSDIKPTDANWNSENSTLDVRAVALLDENFDPSEIVESDITIKITNKSFPNQNLNEFEGTFNSKQFKLGVPQVMNNTGKDLLGGTGMEFLSVKELNKFKIERREQEQILHIKMEVNSKKDPEERIYDDNIWEKDVRIPANNVDLIAKKLDRGLTRPSADWTTVNTSINFITEALNTKEDPTFLTKYPTSPVTLEYTVLAPGHSKVTKNFPHPLIQKTYRNSYILKLPNDPSIPGYTVKLKLVINPNKNMPPVEVTFDNNMLEREIFIPTIQKPLPPIPPTIPDPDLKLPFYNCEILQCYLPRNPKTGQEANILYDIGTFSHKHEIAWIDASGGRTVTDEEVKYLNTGQNIGATYKTVFPRGHENYSECASYVKANQKATGYSWWDVEKFQKSRGGTRDYQHSGVIYKLHIRSTRHQIGTDSDGNPIYCYDYWVDAIDTIEMQNSIKVSSVSEANKTMDHSTQKPITRAGYGIYSQSKISYETDLTKLKSCCKFDTEAYMFMPHLNKRGPTDPKRIVPMDKTNDKAPFPTEFQTAKNPKSLQKLRKQFIDVDYPDGAYPVNFRYKLRAPNFKPSLYPKGSEIALKNKYPAALPALGICDTDTIQVYGNMWDDVWVHPDDPNTLQRR